MQDNQENIINTDELTEESALDQGAYFDQKVSPDQDSSYGVSDEKRNKANQHFKRKMIFNTCIVVLAAVLLCVTLLQVQHWLALVKQSVNNTFALEDTAEVLKSNAEEAENMTTIFHTCNQNMLEDLRLLISGNVLKSYSDREERAQFIEDIIESSGVDYLFALSQKGKIVLAPYDELIGQDPVETGLLSEENYSNLTKGTMNEDLTVTPVLQRGQYGNYYFYSIPVTASGKEYMLVLGVDASLLDSQLEHFTDVASALGSASVENDGFIFAVDLNKGSYRYFQNGGVNLRGHNASSTGLSEKALEDGYEGVETINGKTYYCSSKAYNKDITICVAAPTEKIFRYDRRVLFWTVSGFLLVMVICLAYTIIVRNDFVRNAVDTKKKIFRKNSDNPIILDVSIFNKVAPLMIAGLLVLFGISFYTQSLLEISQSIDKGKILLDNAAERYEENNSNRESISAYYNYRFTAIARLISYLIQANPTLLNEGSERYHSYYDKSGEKIYISDDEGNRLRAITESAELRDLCNINGIDAIFVLNEEGRTIATNTIDWSYAISHDKDDSSYEFLDVLDGKKDVLVQTPQGNEEGEIGQRIGVAFNYYTRTDESNRTEYVSRSEYERNPEGITAHSSMIQIVMNKSFAETLTAAADGSSILSEKMLSGGPILVFDDSDEHNCLLSTGKSHSGKTAKEIGISSKAFAGDYYYGFGRLFDMNTFQYFRNSEGYYIGTATPLSLVYSFRLFVSLLTTLLSFIVILILLGTVTMTTKEEEKLYRVMADDKTALGMDHAIFSIILPSGRRTSTTKAAARWDNRSIPWSARTPEQKLSVLISAAVGLIIVCLIIALNSADSFYSEDSIINYILDGNWDHGPNIFALTACTLVIIGTALFVALIRIPVRLITALLGTRGETVGHLLMSVVKYGSVIAVIFYGLYLLGIDSTNLLASAGILSLVIGLGAQSLIKDIIAGIFIVFEGEFRVGDIVTIGGYRGTVMDIGLRTTKILGIDGNIKIYNNSEISGVLNMTQEASFALCNIDIEYGQDIDYVEAVLERELPALRENNSKIMEGPTYLGIKELRDSGVTLLISCKCSEADILAVTRYLYKGVLQIFYRNNINVPFPHVTFSRHDSEGRKTVNDLINEKLGSMEEEEHRKKDDLDELFGD